MEEEVEMIEIYIPSDNGDAILYPKGIGMKRVALLLNGTPAYIEKDCAVERKYITKEEAKQIERL